MHLQATALKLVLLFSWSLWLTVVLLTNAFEGLKELNRLPEKWKFASDNYAAVRAATSKYSLPGWLPGFLFSGVILWQAIAAGLFWSAFASSVSSGMIQPGTVNPAFTASLGLWLAFIVADEILKVYEGEPNHLMIFISQLLTLLAIYLLPV